jgi:Ser/Thr protein kinase RdoA (MazF antagonist)
MKAKIEHILKKYYPESTDIVYVAQNSGHINSTFFVTFFLQQEKKSLILQKLNTDIFKQPSLIAHNINALNHFLKDKAYRFQKVELLLTCEGEDFVNETSDYWRAINYISNSYTLERCESAGQAFMAGQAFGHFFKALSDCPTDELQTIIPRFHDATWRQEQYHQALKNAKPKRFAEAQSAIAKVSQFQYLVEKYKNVIKEIPIRVTHNDTKISNILFDKNTHQPLAIIDLDTVQSGTVLSEFGDMIRSFCNASFEDEQLVDKIEFRNTIFDALKKGFLSETTEVLTQQEIALLDFGAKLTIFIQGLRFLTDFLNNDTYYKTKYTNHNLVRAKNQFILLEKFLLAYPD